MVKYFIFLFCLILMFNCSGEDSFGVDTTPPQKPDLIEHLGDTGDFITADSVMNFYNTNDPDLENNGIDAITEGDKIQIQWQHLEDSDIDFIKIYRFSYQDYLADTLSFSTCIDTVNYSEQTRYIDENPQIGQNLFYYIDVFDIAGNSTLSDTVCYNLMDKPLVNPVQNPVNNIYDLSFDWDIFESEQYRILVFDENRQLIWHYNLLSNVDPPINYDGPFIEAPATLYWRVDILGSPFVTEPIAGKEYTVESGAESEEGEIYLQ